PLGERPGGGDEEACAHRIAGGDARLEPAGGGGVERQKRAEHQRGECRERCRHAANVVHADVDPRHPRAEETEAEPESRPEAPARPRIAPRVREPGERRERERIEAKRRECADGERAGDKLVNRDCPYLSPLGLSTSSV